RIRPAWPCARGGRLGAAGRAGRRRRRHAEALRSGLVLLLVALREALDASGGVDQLLLAGEERVALGADLEAQLLARGARDELLAARAAHRHFLVLGMDSLFHLVLPLTSVISRVSAP